MSRPLAVKIDRIPPFSNNFALLALEKRHFLASSMRQLVKNPACGEGDCPGSQGSYTISAVITSPQPLTKFP